MHLLGVEYVCICEVMVCTIYGNTTLGILPEVVWGGYGQ